MTPVQLRILRVLSNADTALWPLHIAHTTRIPYGTVYHAMRLLYDLGWAVGVTADDEDTGRPPRVLYRLTVKGRREAALLLDTERNPTP